MERVVEEYGSLLGTYQCNRYDYKGRDCEDGDPSAYGGSCAVSEAVKRARLIRVAQVQSCNAVHRFFNVRS